MPVHTPNLLLIDSRLLVSTYLYVYVLLPAFQHECMTLHMYVHIILMVPAIFTYTVVACKYMHGAMIISIDNLVSTYFYPPHSPQVDFTCLRNPHFLPDLSRAFQMDFCIDVRHWRSNNSSVHMLELIASFSFQHLPSNCSWP